MGINVHLYPSVHDLGVTLDSELTLQRHVIKVASACNPRWSRFLAVSVRTL